MISSWWDETCLEEEAVVLEDEASAWLDDEAIVEDDARFSDVNAQDEDEPSDSERVREEAAEDDSAISSSSQ